MTFEHQIDVDPATMGSAATALTAECRAIVRQTACRSGIYSQCRINNSDSLGGGGATFGCAMGRAMADADSAFGFSPASNHDARRHMSVVTTQPEMLAAAARGARKPLTRSRTVKGQ